MTENTIVYVGIVTFNSREHLPACFAALRAQTYKLVEITVLDNASSDDCVEWIRHKVPQARLIPLAKNLGFARGHNQILTTLELSAIDYYMPLNPDVRLALDYVEKLLEGLQKNQAGWGTGKLLMDSTDLADDPRVYSTGHALRRDGYAINIGYRLLDNGDFTTSKEIFGAPGAATLISKPLIADLAPDGELFDRSMFMYNEDVDLDWRARRLGWRCWYIAEAKAMHRGGSATQPLRLMALGNRFLSILKNGFWRDLIFYNIPLMAVHSLARLVVSPRQGLWLLTHVARGVWPMMRKRRKPRIDRPAMQRWFDEAKHSNSGQPQNLRQRLQNYWQHRRNSA